MTADIFYDRARHIVNRRLHRIVRMRAAEQLTQAQALEAAHVAESTDYYNTVVLLLKRHPALTYGEALVAERQGRAP